VCTCKCLLNLASMLVSDGSAVASVSPMAAAKHSEHSVAMSWLIGEDSQYAVCAVMLAAYCNSDYTSFKWCKSDLHAVILVCNFD
jgi:predicted benzoate:H+ symporter BenE